MFNRPGEFRRTDEWLKDLIMLTPGETADSRYKAWLEKKLAEAHFCPRHPRVQLVFASSFFRKAYKIETLGNPLSDHGEIEPGRFYFKAVLSCPICRCTYARCPPEFHESGFDTFETSTTERLNSLARCREFAVQVNQKGCGFALLVGGPGTGKTRLACNVIRVLADGDALYVRQGEVTSELRASYGRKQVLVRSPYQRNDDDEEADSFDPPTPLKIVQRVPFLVLDELGCTALSNDEQLLLDELLKHRYEQRKPTILVSNLALDVLQDFLGDAPYDRIRHASGGGKFILQFQGESYRRSSEENYLAGLG